MTRSLLTDHYELTMLQAARAAGTAGRRCVFEVFTRSLPPGRRYGVLAGIGRLLEDLADFRFDDEDLGFLSRAQVIDPDTLRFLESYRFTGDIIGYEEGDLFLPHSPVLRVEGTFAETVILETWLLSLLNHDCAVAAVGSRMVREAAGRDLIEMGSRRVHEEAAVASARAAAIAGFAATSNLAAGARYGIATAGTSAHAFTLLFDAERDAFAAQVASMGTDTTILVDTYDIEQAVADAVDIAGTGLGAVRLDSGDLTETAPAVRAQLDALGATGTQIVASGDLDEYAVRAAADLPVDAFGIGTKLVTGGGYPATGLVFKLVERESGSGAMEPVAKSSAGKATTGGRKQAVRAVVDGRPVAEVIGTGNEPLPAGRDLQVPLVRGGEVLEPLPPAERVQRAADRHRTSIAELGIDPHEPVDGDVAIPTVNAPVNPTLL